MNTVSNFQTKNIFFSQIENLQQCRLFFQIHQLNLYILLYFYFQLDVICSICHVFQTCFNEKWSAK